MQNQEKAVFTNLCMIYNDCNQILVQHRTSKHWPGVTFPGGHVEKGESFTRSIIREVKEETNLDIINPILCGIKQFQTEEDARYVVLFYKCNNYQGELKSSEEGEVFWIDKQGLKNYPLAADFQDMIPIFMDDSLQEFYYYLDQDEWKYEIL